MLIIRSNLISSTHFSGSTLCGFFEFLVCLEERLQALLLSMFAAILRKSTYNLEQCSKNNFISKIIELLPKSRDVVAELLGDILSVLASYNLSVYELKSLMKQLRSIEKDGKQGMWLYISCHLKYIPAWNYHRENRGLRFSHYPKNSPISQSRAIFPVGS